MNVTLSMLSAIVAGFFLVVSTVGLACLNRVWRVADDRREAERTQQDSLSHCVGAYHRLYDRHAEVMQTIKVLKLSQEQDRRHADKVLAEAWEALTFLAAEERGNPDAAGSVDALRACLASYAEQPQWMFLLLQLDAMPQIVNAMDLRHHREDGG